MTPDRYFDNAATTPLDPRVLDAMLPYYREAFGNANSIHGFGLRARAAVEKATEQVAALLEVSPEQLFFTSGATESNNWVLSSALGPKRPSSKRIAISPFEHSAVRAPALLHGAILLDNEEEELLPLDEPVGLVSVMSVNNETGTRWDVRDYAADAKRLHADITQSVGKLPVALEEIDYASFSAHKFYGPKGVGGLYVLGEPPAPFIIGGEQQHEMRGGTLNVPGIVGMGAAAEFAREEMEADFEHVTSLRGAFLSAISQVGDHRINGGTETSPYILSISFLGLEGETLVIELDRAGFAVSAGAACSSDSTEPSHVLTALGLSEEWLRGTIRISFGRTNTRNSTEKLAEECARIAEKLRTM